MGDIADVETYFVKHAPSSPEPIDPINGVSIPFLVNDQENPMTAVNFPSVDGLLVYDDSLLRDAEAAVDKREVLLRTGVPVYINRLTGAIVEGPVGETP